jgi:aspartate aminotransferase
MISTLEEEAVEHDVVLLHPCAHNPTGIDPTREQWQQIAEIVKRKKLFALFDSAYQGFASGDLDADAWAIRYFYTTLWDGGAAEPAGMAVCQSFSKNFSLYGERVGALHLVTPPSVPTQGAYSQLVRLVRSDISNAPRFGVRIVETVLSHPTLREGWCGNLQTMSQRIRDRRQALRRELERLGTKGDWSHVTSQVGMFSYTGLTKLQVDKLRELHHVYLMQTG